MSGLDAIASSLLSGHDYDPTIPVMASCSEKPEKKAKAKHENKKKVFSMADMRQINASARAIKASGEHKGKAGKASEVYGKAKIEEVRSLMAAAEKKASAAALRAEYTSPDKVAAVQNILAACDKKADREKKAKAALHASQVAETIALAKHLQKEWTSEAKIQQVEKILAAATAAPKTPVIRKLTPTTVKPMGAKVMSSARALDYEVADLSPYIM
jgi:hypothetical protein